MHKTLSLGYTMAETEDCKKNLFCICNQKWRFTPGITVWELQLGILLPASLFLGSKEAESFEIFYLVAGILQGVNHQGHVDGHELVLRLDCRGWYTLAHAHNNAWSSVCMLTFRYKMDFWWRPDKKETTTRHQRFVLERNFAFFRQKLHSTPIMFGYKTCWFDWIMHDELRRQPRIPTFFRRASAWTLGYNCSGVGKLCGTTYNVLCFFQGHACYEYCG